MRESVYIQSPRFLQKNVQILIKKKSFFDSKISCYSRSAKEGLYLTIHQRESYLRYIPANGKFLRQTSNRNSSQAAGPAWLDKNVTLIFV